jgi:hypothetical protein
MKLHTFKVRDELVWNELRNTLGGFAFFRKDDSEFWVKMPINDYVKILISEGKILDYTPVSQNL